MATPTGSHRFTAPILRQDYGMKQHYAPIPTDLANDYLAHGIRRIVVTMNGRDVRRAIQSSKDGDRFILLGIPLLREIRAGFGDMVEITMRPDPEPDLVDLGEEFTAVLELDDEAAERFYAMTPGRQRSLALYVTSAKRTETRIARALELAEKIRTRTLYGDRKKEG